MGNFGVLVVSVRSHPPSNSPLEGGRVRSVRALACGLNLMANHVEFSFRASDTPCTDEADGAGAVCMRHDKQAPKAGLPKGNIPGLSRRMVRVGTRYSQLVKKYRGALIKGNAMLGKICRRL